MSRNSNFVPKRRLQDQDLGDDDVAPEPRKTSKPFHRGNRGKNASQKRFDDHRRKDSEDFVKKFDAERAKRVPAGFTPVPNLTSTEAVAHNCSQVPISTRGIGAAVAKNYSAAQTQYGTKVTGVCSVHQAFRCCLLQATYCIQRAAETRPRSTLRLEPQTDVYLPNEISSLVVAYTKTLSLVSVVTSGIGCFDESKGSFWTFVPVTTAGSVDRMYHYTALNLRELVSNAARDPSFQEHSTIPGAVFNDAGLLTNGATICPRGWPSRATVLADFEGFNSMMSFLEGKMPWMIGDVTYEGKCMSYSLMLRCLSDGLPGNVTIGEGGVFIFNIPYDVTYFSRYVLDDGSIIRGVLSLLGEQRVCQEARSNALISSTVDWNQYASRVTQR